jgi:hypothetical protein
MIASISGRFMNSIESLIVIPLADMCTKSALIAFLGDKIACARHDSYRQATRDIGAAPCANVHSAVFLRGDESSGTTGLREKATLRMTRFGFSTAIS